MNKKPGELVSELEHLRAKLTKINKTVKELKSQKAQLDQEMANTLEELGLDFLGNGTHRAGLNIDIVPDVYDWGEFGEFIIAEKSLYLLERRPSVPAYRELLEEREGEAVPGVKPFNRKTISLRRL